MCVLLLCLVNSVCVCVYIHILYSNCVFVVCVCVCLCMVISNILPVCLDILYV